MKRRVKIITSVLLWVSWYSALSITSAPRFSSDLLQSLPVTYNPFTMAKWMFWDNALASLVICLWIVAASCVTYAYTRLWERR